MQEKLKMWRQERPWEESCAEWEEKSQTLKHSHPLKILKTLPQMPGITKETAKGLKFKSIYYLLSHDKDRIFARYFFKHPLKYSFRWIKSALKKKSYQRQGDFFLYGFNDVAEFTQEMKKEKTLLVVGFSYCHKPLECPSGRFTQDCMHQPEHPVCGQCFIGKSVNALPLDHKKIKTLFIPTIHYIGEKIFEIAEKNPKSQILFLITACEMTLEMFGDWGNMVGARGLGVRLDGRICNTMKAFELSEKGIKPGLTVVLPETQAQILSLIQQMWEPVQSHIHADDEKA